MRALISIVLVAFTAWSGWWYFASQSALSGAQSAVSVLQSQGWTANYKSVSVAGYPNRVDLNFDTPVLMPPASPWGWSAPFLQLFALSYKPWHVIAAFPNAQTLQTPAGEMQLQSERLQASVVFRPAGDLPFDRAQVSGQALSLLGLGHWRAEALNGALREAVAETNAYDLGVELLNITPDAGLTDLLPRGLLPDQIPLLRLDATASLTAPLNRYAPVAQPQITAINLRELRSEWGPIRLHLSGRLTPDAAGYAEGTLTLRVEGTDTLLELLGASDVIAEKDMRNLAFALKALSGGGSVLSLPLNFARGKITLAVFPLGDAPRLRF